METQQMMELLLARMNASMKEQMQEMAADRKADQARMEAKIHANRESDREELKGMINANLKDLCMYIVGEGLKRPQHRDHP
jgi:hypothetical protein